MKTLENKTLSWQNFDEILGSTESVALQLKPGALAWLHRQAI